MTGLEWYPRRSTVDDAQHPPIPRDACSAWRADLADMGLADPLPEDVAEQWILWLEIATVFERLRALPIDERARYAHGTAPLWARAERITGSARFAQVGVVMAGWEGAAPELSGFRELLWAVEQGEGEGGVRLALAQIASFSGLVAPPDLRAGYAIAQTGRTFRMLGMLSSAENQLFEALRIGERHDDSWLISRSRLGLAVLMHAKGNYPAARSGFLHALEHSSAHQELTMSAHIGVVSASLTLGAWREATAHAAAALGTAQKSADDEVEILAMLADVAVEIGHFEIASRVCSVALQRKLKRRRLPFFLRVATLSAVMRCETVTLLLWQYVFKGKFHSW